MGIALNTLEKARKEIEEILDRIEKGIWLAEGGDREPAPRPCPFCGGEAEIVKMGFEVEIFIRCTDCLVETPWYPSRKKAIEAWNRRA